MLYSQLQSEFFKVIILICVRFQLSVVFCVELAEPSRSHVTHCSISLPKSQLRIQNDRRVERLLNYSYRKTVQNFYLVARIWKNDRWNFEGLEDNCLLDISRTNQLAIISTGGLVISRINQLADI